jgi:hypothetical protein
MLQCHDPIERNQEDAMSVDLLNIEGLNELEHQGRS